MKIISSSIPLFWTVSVVLLILYLVEEALTIRFYPFIFKIGIPVLRTSEAFIIDWHRVPSNRTMATMSGRFKFVDSETCLFVPHHSQWLRSRILTPLPIRGTMRLEANTVEIKGRIPLSTGMFLLLLPVSLTASLLEVLLVESMQSTVMLGLGILLVWIVSLGMFFLSIPYERKRAQGIVNELKEYMQGSESQHLVDPDTGPF